MTRNRRRSVVVGQRYGPDQWPSDEVKLKDERLDDLAEAIVVVVETKKPFRGPVEVKVGASPEPEFPKPPRHRWSPGMVGLLTGIGTAVVLGLGLSAGVIQFTIDLLPGATPGQQATLNAMLGGIVSGVVSSTSTLFIQRFLR